MEQLRCHDGSQQSAWIDRNSAEIELHRKRPGNEDRHGGHSRHCSFETGDDAANLGPGTHRASTADTA